MRNKECDVYEELRLHIHNAKVGHQEAGGRGKLSSDNRWVIMADLIPWKEFEEEYSSKFSAEMEAPAKSFRMALGALQQFSGN